MWVSVTPKRLGKNRSTWTFSLGLLALLSVVITGVRKTGQLSQINTVVIVTCIKAFFFLMMWPRYVYTCPSHLSPVICQVYSFCRKTADTAVGFVICTSGGLLFPQEPRSGCCSQTITSVNHMCFGETVWNSSHYRDNLFEVCPPRFCFFSSLLGSWSFLVVAATLSSAWPFIFTYWFLDNFDQAKWLRALRSYLIKKGGNWTSEESCEAQ